MRWNNVKLDLNELARLRWIKKMTTPQISREMGKCRSVVQVSSRTIRNSGVSRLNLSELEKITIQIAINEEIEKLHREQKNFKINSVSAEFRKKVL